MLLINMKEATSEASKYEKKKDMVRETGKLLLVSDICDLSARRSPVSRLPPPPPPPAASLDSFCLFLVRSPRIFHLPLEDEDEVARPKPPSSRACPSSV